MVTETFETTFKNVNLNFFYVFQTFRKENVGEEHYGILNITTWLRASGDHRDILNERHLLASSLSNPFVNTFSVRKSHLIRTFISPFTNHFMHYCLPS